MPLEKAIVARRRRPLAPPPGLSDHVSRADAAKILGYPSIFRIRQLEREGRLRAARGVMGSAWYARRDVLAVRAAEQGADAAVSPGPAGLSPVGRRRADTELIAYLRGFGATGAARRAPTVADLVADTGISIARAQKVHRFWVTHDAHPAAEAARAGGGRAAAPSPPPDGARPGARPGERRSSARLERAALIRQLRAADPAVRATAFAALKNTRPTADEP